MLLKKFLISLLPVFQRRRQPRPRRQWGVVEVVVVGLEHVPPVCPPSSASGVSGVGGRGGEGEGGEEEEVVLVDGVDGVGGGAGEGRGAAVAGAVVRGGGSGGQWAGALAYAGRLGEGRSLEN